MLFFDTASKNLITIAVIELLEKFLNKNKINYKTISRSKNVTE